MNLCWDCQDIRWLLRASSRKDDMILTQPPPWPWRYSTNRKLMTHLQLPTVIICYRCPGPNYFAKDCQYRHGEIYLFDAKGTPWRMMLFMSQSRPSCIELAKNQTRAYDFSASLVPSQVMKKTVHVKSNPNQVDKLMRDMAEMAWLKKSDQTYATCLYEISEQVQFSLNKVYSLPKWTYWHQTNPVLCKIDWSWSLLVGHVSSGHGMPEVPVHWSFTDTLGKNGE